MKINTRIGSFGALAYAKKGPVYMVHGQFHDAEKTLSFAFEKQEVDVGNGVSFGRNMVSPVSWLIWKPDGRKLYAIGKFGAR